MPGKGIEYALLAKKYRFDNIRQTVASHRDREREKERYMLAANRNMLQQQKANLKNSLERLPVPTRQYYMEQIQNFDKQIESNKKMFPNFKSKYDM